MSNPFEKASEENEELLDVKKEPYLKLSKPHYATMVANHHYEFKSITEANEDSSNCITSLYNMGTISKVNIKDRVMVNQTAKSLSKIILKKSMYSI